MSEEPTRFRQLPSPPPVEGGGRVELRAATMEPGNECVYEGRFFVGDASFEGRFRVRTTPTINVTTEIVDAALPGWLLDFTTTLLRTTARSAAQSGFPRRLTRWRAKSAAGD